MAPTAPFDREVIEQIIPHRDPFLFLDEVLELEPGVRVVARKLVTGDEWFFPGHFPGRPIVPGVIMVEACAQVAAVCALTHPDHQGKFGVFAAIDETRFTRLVRPGDVLDMTIVMERLRMRLGRCSAAIAVGGEPAVKATLTFGLLDEAPA